MPLDFDNIYTYHAPDGKDIIYYKAIRDKAKELAILIESVCPDSRERSVAFTNLESAVMWANASIARK